MYATIAIPLILYISLCLLECARSTIIMCLLLCGLLYHVDSFSTLHIIYKFYKVVKKIMSDQFGNFELIKYWVTF